LEDLDALMPSAHPLQVDRRQLARFIGHYTESRKESEELDGMLESMGAPGWLRSLLLKIKADVVIEVLPDGNLQSTVRATGGIQVKKRFAQGAKSALAIFGYKQEQTTRLVLDEHSPSIVTVGTWTKGSTQISTDTTTMSFDDKTDEFAIHTENAHGQYMRWFKRYP